MFVPSKVFFTKGVGVHEDELVSFEMALRDAHVSPFNLVTVSSIMPPRAQIVSREEGLAGLQPGEVVFCVMARLSTNADGETIASSVGLAVPPFEANHHGFLSEHHERNISGDACGSYAEQQAVTMLGTLMGEEHVPTFTTSNITSSATGKAGVWTTAISLAIFVP